MYMEVTWPAIGVIVAVLGHALFTVASAASFKATISVKIDSLVASLQKLDKELETRDKQIAAAWRKIDGLNSRLTVIETKCNLVNHEREQ